MLRSASGEQLKFCELDVFPTGFNAIAMQSQAKPNKFCNIKLGKCALLFCRTKLALYNQWALDFFHNAHGSF